MEAKMADQTLTPRLLPQVWDRIDKVALTGVLILPVLGRL